MWDLKSIALRRTSSNLVLGTWFIIIRRKSMARSRIILEKGMLLGEGQLKFVREIEGKTYPSGVYERWVEVICPKCGKIFQTSLNRIRRKSTGSKKPVTQCPDCSLKENNKRVSQLGHSMIDDLTGQVFGNLTVIGITDKRKNGYNVIWHCKCTCGNEVDVKGSDLKRGHTTSCGCIKSTDMSFRNEFKIIKQRWNKCLRSRNRDRCSYFWSSSEQGIQ